jgi:signal peptidase I
VETHEAHTRLTWRSPCVRRKVLWTALSVAFACYAFFTWVLWPVKVVGESMLPNFQHGSRYFINKLAYASDKPQRGDVVALRGPGDDVYLKRVVGLPGEQVSFENGLLHINGRLVREPYTESRVPAKWRMKSRLEHDEYFVIGDNRGVSVFGPVSEPQIIGKVVF